MKFVRDQNGNIVYRNLEKVDGGWAINVWYGGGYGPATTIARYVYRTRKDARDGDISDTIGKRGMVGRIERQPITGRLRQSLAICGALLFLLSRPIFPNVTIL